LSASRQRPLEQIGRMASQECLPRSLLTTRHSRRIQMRRSNEKMLPVNYVAFLNVLEFNLYTPFRTEGPQLYASLQRSSCYALLPTSARLVQRSLISWLRAFRLRRGLDAERYHRTLHSFFTKRHITALLPSAPPLRLNQCLPQDHPRCRIGL